MLLLSPVLHCYETRRKSFPFIQTCMFFFQLLKYSCITMSMLCSAVLCCGVVCVLCCAIGCYFYLSCLNLCNYEIMIRLHTFIYLFYVIGREHQMPHSHGICLQLQLYLYLTFELIKLSVAAVLLFHRMSIIADFAMICPEHFCLGM